MFALSYAYLFTLAEIIELASKGQLNDLNNYENVNIIDMFFPFPGFNTNNWVIIHF